MSQGERRSLGVPDRRSDEAGPLPLQLLMLFLGGRGLDVHGTFICAGFSLFRESRPGFSDPLVHHLPVESL